MPEEPLPKSRPHPVRAFAAEPRSTRKVDCGYAELQVTSNFTFLTGASHPDELVQAAALLGYRAIAITDCNTVAGIVRAHVPAKELGIQFVVGCRLRLKDGLSILVYPTDLASYGRMCRLLTLGKRRAPKGQCHLTLADLGEYADGLLAAVVPPRTLDDGFAETLHRLKRPFGDDRLSLVASHAYTQRAERRLSDLHGIARHCRVRLLATNDVHYHTPERRALQDVLTCIRHGCTIERAGMKLLANAERHLKPGAEMHRLFARYPEAIARSLEIADRTKGFSLDQLRYQYPDEVMPGGGQMAMQHLTELTWAGAAKRYPDGLPEKVRTQVEHELKLIDELHYAPYFLTVQDIVRFAQSQRILCQGRGAAANSAVCYCLGVTAVDPDRVNMLFERFISKERDEPPDIDIDIEHERREEVIQYLYRKYGRDRAALTAVVISYRGRSAVRDVGKAMGLSLDCVDRMAKQLDWWDKGSPDAAKLREIGVNPNNKRIGQCLRLADELLGFPRHLSQHVGGFVITRTPLSELVPIENAAMDDRTVIEWDKDDIDALRMLKVDCLGLGMLTCLRKAMALTAQHEGKPWTLATIPSDDRPTYRLIKRADTVGVFQVESRAQMAMLPRLLPDCYYDLVIEVAIVRPGPIQGDMVHPYLKRRSGLEKVEYASPEIERVLGRTLGVPLFQEQAMTLAVVAAGFTPGEADQLRRAMAAWKRSGTAILKFEKKLIEGMRARGHSEKFAKQTFQQITGFSGYGFPESHAASFALLVYASCYLKCHHPAAFAAALLNSQPMGFYQPAQIVRDAEQHGVAVRPIDVNRSRWDCTLETGENGPAIRLGMRLVGGLGEAEANTISDAVQRAGPFANPLSLFRASDAKAASLKKLARADAFGSMGLTRQQALWAVEAIRDDDLPLFQVTSDQQPGETADWLPAVSRPAEVRADYEATGLSIKDHPVRFIRDQLDAIGVTPNDLLMDPKATPTGRTVTVAGVVLIRQRPGTASGIVFITLEDESGVANLIVRPDTFKRFRKAARHSRLIACTGKVERAGQVVHVLARSIRGIDEMAEELAAPESRDFH